MLWPRLQTCQMVSMAMCPKANSDVKRPQFHGIICKHLDWYQKENGYGEEALDIVELMLLEVLRLDPVILNCGLKACVS